MELTKKIVLEFLKNHKIMAVATYGEHPWIASVYYSFDREINLYFLSDPKTLHCRQIARNNQVAVSIADSHQKVSDKKKGLQMFGVSEQIGDAKKIQHALRLWKEALCVVDPKLTYDNMVTHVITGRMYKVTPKRIKFFNQELFSVKDGEEPVLEL